MHAVILAGRVSGGQVHDARIAALCQLHGVRELWTADRDFSRFPRLQVRNPLVAWPFVGNTVGVPASRAVMGNTGGRTQDD